MKRLMSILLCTLILMSTGSLGLMSAYAADEIPVYFYRNRTDYENRADPTVQPLAVVNYAIGDVIASKAPDAPEVEGQTFRQWAILSPNTGNPQVLNANRKMNANTPTAWYAEYYTASYTYWYYNYQTESWVQWDTVYGYTGDTLSSRTVKAKGEAISNQMLGISEDASFNVQAAYADPNGKKIMAGDLEFDGNQNLYLFTQLVAKVTLYIPKWDETTNSYLTEYVEYKPTVYPPAQTKNFSYRMIISSFKKQYPDHQGYNLDGWTPVDGDGAYRTNGSDYYFTMDLSQRSDYSFRASYTNSAYIIKIMFHESSPQFTILSTQELHVGDTVNLYDIEYIDESNHQAFELPAIGYVNEFDDGGHHAGKNGYELIDWATKSGDQIVGSKFTLTTDLLNTSSYYDSQKKEYYLTLKGVWEVQYYDARFFVETPDSTPENPKYAEPYVLSNQPAGTSLSTMQQTDTVQAAEAAPAPKGYKFSYWAPSDKLKAGGSNYYAKYTKETYQLYILWDEKRTDENGNPVLEKKKNLTSFQGFCYQDHLLAQEQKDGSTVIVKEGFGYYLTHTSIVGERPGADYECVGWKYYHVDNEEDVYDRNKWKSGINDISDPADPNYDSVESIVIIVPQWKTHHDFFYIWYDSHKTVAKALGKDFKIYYFVNGNKTTKDRFVPEERKTYFVGFLKPTLENFDRSRFFDISMWRSVALRLDTISLPKSMFTIEGMKATFDMIFNLIKSLRGGL